MGARVNGANGAFGLMMAVAVATGCAGRSQRLDDDDGGEAATGGASVAGGSAGANGSGAGGAGGTISTGGGAIGGAGGDAGAAFGGATAGGGAGPAGASFGEGGMAAGPPLSDPFWFHSGSLALSKRAFQRTVAALLGLPRDETIPRERSTLHLGFDPKLEESVSAELVAVARMAVASMGEAALLEVLGCADASRACAEAIVADFAPRAFRRPLAPAESEAILAVYDSTRLPSPVTEAVMAVLSSTSAQWIRSVGTPDDNGAVYLDDFEIASLLSYGITGLPPDDLLWAAAVSGELREPARRRQEAERLLRSDDGRITFQEFVRDWFRIRDADQLWFYEENPALAEAMVLETDRFVQVAMYEDGAPAPVLVAAPWSMLSPELVEHYGIVTMNASERVDLSATRRRGILHHASFLASRSYGEQHGLIARSTATLNLLCEMLPDAPAEVPPIPPPDPAGTYRERLSQATAEPTCQGCHSVLDPVAFSFGKFDSYGAFVELENGAPIDSTGTVTTFDGLTFTFDDSADLAEQMAEHPKFAECFHRNLVVSFVGAHLRDTPTTDYVERAGSQQAMLDTVLSWTESEHFVRRMPTVR